MPAWLSELMTPQTLGVLAALAFIGWLVYKVAPFFRKLSHFVDDVVGEEGRPGVPRRPGLMERIAAVEETGAEHTRRLDVVTKEVKNSHVTNLREDIDEIGAKLDTHIQVAADESRMLRDLHRQYASRKDET